MTTLTPDLISKLRADAQDADRWTGPSYRVDPATTLALLDELDFMWKQLRRNETKLERLRAKCERYRAALEYYADPSKHDRDKPGARIEFGCGCCAGTVGDDEILDHDSEVRGFTAREALREDGPAAGEGGEDV